MKFMYYYRNVGVHFCRFDACSFRNVSPFGIYICVTNILKEEDVSGFRIQWIPCYKKN